MLLFQRHYYLLGLPKLYSIIVSFTLSLKRNNAFFLNQSYAHIVCHAVMTRRAQQNNTLIQITSMATSQNGSSKHQPTRHFATCSDQEKEQGLVLVPTNQIQNQVGCNLPRSSLNHSYSVWRQWKIFQQKVSAAFYYTLF